MKRERQQESTHNFDLLPMSLTFLSQSQPSQPTVSSSSPFECKTCNRRFSSFQALGGHRASHKKPKLDSQQEPKKLDSVHECSICGLRFSLGQALGGHMRKHRTAMEDSSPSVKLEVAHHAPQFSKDAIARGLCAWT